MIEIWIYSLVTFEVKKILVDEISNGKAQIKKKSKSKENQQTWKNFELTKYLAERRVLDYLDKEIALRQQRLEPLIKAKYEKSKLDRPRN